MSKGKGINPSVVDVFSWLSALFLFLLGMWQFHNTEFYSNFDLVPGGRGDPRLVTALLEYFHQALHGVGKIGSPAFYYPTQGTLGYADVFFSYAVLYDWLRRGGNDIFTSIQICVFTADALNFLCCFFLLRKGFNFAVAASGLGAFLFVFNAPKFNQIGHVQLQCLFWIPLVLWCLVEVAKKGRSMKPARAFGLLALAAVFLNLQLLSSFYDSWFFLFWGFLYLVLAFCIPSTRLFLKDLILRHRLPVLGALAVFLVTLIPFILVYLPVISELGGKSYDEVKMMIPNLWAYLWMGPRHGLWGWFWDSFSGIRSLPVDGEERMGFGLGLFVVWLALTWTAVRVLKKNLVKVDKNKIYVPFVSLTILTTSLFILLAFQYPGDWSPWWLFYKIIPGAGSIRAVSRCALILALPMGIVLAHVSGVLLEKAFAERKPLKKILIGGFTLFVAGFIVWEQVDLPPFEAFSKNLELNRLEYLSQKLPANSKVFYATVKPGLPYTATDIQIDTMLLSAVRGIPTLNGYSGQSPANGSWWLFRVRSPKYEEYVRNWINLHQIPEPVFRLEIDK